MKLERLEGHIEKGEAVIAAFCLITSTVLIFIAAVMRSISQPINWSLDISLFLFAWATFLSADVAYREDKLVNLDFLISALPEKGRKTLQLLIYTVILVFLLALIYYGFILAWKTRARAFQGIPSFSYSWITLSLPIGAMLLTRSTVEKIAVLLGNRDPLAGKDRQIDEEHFDG